MLCVAHPSLALSITTAPIWMSGILLATPHTCAIIAASITSAACQAGAGPMWPG
ncbi:hypothetical protein PGTUg99_003065 [Puccinia graminis f. sp. tritici]|uniref:Uncharacterized protein n=1 Tax=Puccinia graminis f. sp. tritici TaxID=56615 RepID=A0A5B0PQJ3_PUCGR|nr:hypothetical protein PGTUg99_003065 [Puccinia graminis f. sp. tritici]